MMTKKTKDTSIETTTVTPQPEIEPVKSGVKIIIAPLFLYAVIAIAMVSVIVTSAVYLGKPFQHYDTEVAARKADHEENVIASADSIDNKDVIATSNTSIDPVSENTTVITAEHTKANEKTTSEGTTKEQPIGATNKTISVDSTVQQPVVAVVDKATENSTEKQPVVAIVDTQSLAQDSVVTDKLEKTKTYKQKYAALMAKNYALIIQQNNKSLQQMKLSQQRQIDALRAQLSAQQSMIVQSIKQMQSIYEARTAALKRSHDNQQAMLRKM